MLFRDVAACGDAPPSLTLPLKGGGDSPLALAANYLAALNAGARPHPPSPREGEGDSPSRLAHKGEGDSPVASPSGPSGRGRPKPRESGGRAGEGVTLGHKKRQTSRAPFRALP